MSDEKMFLREIYTYLAATDGQQTDLESLQLSKPKNVLSVCLLPARAGLPSILARLDDDTMVVVVDGTIYPGIPSVPAQDQTRVSCSTSETGAGVTVCRAGNYCTVWVGDRLVSEGACGSSII